MAKFRSAYSPRVRVDLSFLDEEGQPLPTLTQQHAKAECDINNILRQYDRTGVITHVAKAAGQYGDFTAVNEYQESLNMVIAAQEAFMELPSGIRKQFANDPGAFFEFATDPANADQMVALGLANPPQVVAEPVVKAPTEGA